MSETLFITNLVCGEGIPSSGSQSTETSIYTTYRTSLEDPTPLKAVKSTNFLRSLTFLRLLLSRGLRGHVDGGGSHADRAASRHQVEFHGLPGDERSRHLHVLRQAQVGAETGHEVSGGD